jgi:hypothetical protein
MTDLKYILFVHNAHLPAQSQVQRQRPRQHLHVVHDTIHNMALLSDRAQPSNTHLQVQSQVQRQRPCWHFQHV